MASKKRNNYLEYILNPFNLFRTKEILTVNPTVIPERKEETPVKIFAYDYNAEEVPNIKAALQLHYAGNDERVNAGIPAYEEALKANKINYELYMYEGAQHAFHNDTAPTRYNEAAAKLAWGRTLEFFGKHVK